MIGCQKDVNTSDRTKTLFNFYKFIININI